MGNFIQYKYRIKLFKCVLLGASFLVLSIILFYLYTKNLSSGESAPVVKRDKSVKEYALNINNSIFEGKTSSLVPYQISARDVIKDKSENYIFNIVQGKYFLPNGHVSVKSDNATLDDIEKILTLTKNVTFTFNNAILACQELSFNLNTQEAYSNVGVEVNFNESTVKADSFKTKGSNNIIEFQGNVKSSVDIKNE